MPKPWRADFVYESLRLIGTPYRWGGKHPDVGLDCSGLVTFLLWKLCNKDWRATHNTDALWTQLPEAINPRAGDLVLYGGKGPLDVEHVMVLVLQRPDSNWICVGACGGDDTVLTPERAQEKNARVKVRRAHTYRSDVRGFRSLTSFLAD